MKAYKRILLRMFSDPHISEDLAAHCACEITKINQSRLRYLIPPIIIALLGILAVYAYNAVTDGLNALTRAYIITDALYLLFLTGFYFIWRRRRNDWAKRFNTLMYIVFFVTLSWAAVLSLLDQYGFNSMTCYIMAILLLSIALVIKPRVFVALQAAVLLPLLAALPFFQTDGVALMGNYINTLFSSILAVFMSSLTYNSNFEAIANRKIIENKNAELSELVARLTDLSETDPLTELLNRRKFDEIIRLEWRRAIRNASELTLIIIDVDNFKEYNDTYGHLKGDECLVQIAKTLQSQHMRANEYVARYGGEEFAIVMADAGADDGTLACERLINSVAALQIPHAHSKAGVVTVSAGMMVIEPTEYDSLEDFINKADLALYAAKGSGKNRHAVAV